MNCFDQIYGNNSAKDDGFKVSSPIFKYSGFYVYNTIKFFKHNNSSPLNDITSQDILRHILPN